MRPRAAQCARLQSSQRSSLARLLVSSTTAAVLLSPHVVAAKKPPRKARSETPIRYSVTVKNPEQQYVDVHVEVPKSRAKETVVSIPVWTPGSYKVRDFGRHIHGLRASSTDGQSIPVVRESKSSWKVDNDREAFHLDYRVFAEELSVRTCYLDDAVGLLNGSCLFVYVEGKKFAERPAELSVSAPNHWNAHVALPERGAGGQAQHYRAANYDALVDAPLFMGPTTERSFKIGSHRFTYIVNAPAGTNASLSRLAQDTEKVVEAFGSLMGDLPSKDYEFYVLLDNLGRGGGLEHRDGTAMILPSWSFGNEKGYMRAAKLAAHEFFHAWNVKRLHDEVLGPFDYSKENYTDLLWFHEGFTDTMEAKGMLKSGLFGPEQFLSELADRYKQYIDTPGRDQESITELSRQAWVKLYQKASNYRNTAISYYLKGDIIGTALDIEMRLRSAKHGKQASVEALLRTLWQEREEGTDERPITFDDVRSTCTTLTGESMDWFFERYVYGREAIPLPELLKSIGVEVQAHAPWQDDDGDDDPSKASKKVYLGIVGSGTSVRSVEPGSPAARANLMPGDEVIALDDVRIKDLAQLRERLGARQPGDRVQLALFRSGRLLRRDLTLEENPHKRWTFSLPEGDEVGKLPQLDRWLYREPDSKSSR